MKFFAMNSNFYAKKSLITKILFLIFLPYSESAIKDIKDDLLKLNFVLAVLFY
jgi:hypothetical protein